MPDRQYTFEELNDTTPMVPAGSDVEIEPVALIDTSGSNEWPAVENGRVSRWELVTELMQGVVGKLAALDSQAEHEEDGGGLMTVRFANPKGNAHEATVIGDLNPDNFATLWGKISVGGGTWAMPGWNLMLDNFVAEFKDEEEVPVLGVLAVTDGQMADLSDFTKTIAGVGDTVKVVLAVHGYGDDHDEAVAAYKKVESAHPNALRVLQVTPGTPPNVVGDAMLAILGKN
jgi:hypothetical protein